MFTRQHARTRVRARTPTHTYTRVHFFSIAGLIVRTRRAVDRNVCGGRRAHVCRNSTYVSVCHAGPHRDSSESARGRYSMIHMRRACTIEAISHAIPSSFPPRRRKFSSSASDTGAIHRWYMYIALIALTAAVINRAS